MELLTIAKHAVEAAKNKKAKRMVLMDLNKQSDMCQFQFVCSGENNIHTKAIAREIDDVLRVEHGIKPVRVEGKGSGHWILLDYSGVLVHVFFDYIRDYYAIESIWPEAKILDLP